jgi:hypothetical protein
MLIGPRRDDRSARLAKQTHRIAPRQRLIRSLDDDEITTWKPCCCREDSAARQNRGAPIPPGAASTGLFLEAP